MTEWHPPDSYRAQLEGIETAKKLCMDANAGSLKILGLATGLIWQGAERTKRQTTTVYPQNLGY